MRALKLFFISVFAFFSVFAQAERWTIAIDPGHGGKDPGAIGKRLRLYEKNVTFSIAKELKALLDSDPRFKGELTRKGDYFIPVPNRSEIARKAKANLLISIHADAAQNRSASGASVWVLSTRRANTEMGKWLEDHEKTSELLGGAATVLASHNEIYLNKTVLDLQFRHSQKVGYELAQIVLRNFKKIASIKHKNPQHASLGVLRSPDIPSILVETGFLSNSHEEKLLSSPSYRKKVATMIYNSLVEYYRLQMSIRDKQSPTPATKETTTLTDSGQNYLVKRGDTLSKISRQYNVSVETLQQVNQLKSTNLNVGQRLRIPKIQEMQPRLDPFSVLNELSFKEETPAPTIEKIPSFYVVKKGDTLHSISRQFNVSLSTLKKLNPRIKKGAIFVGQKMKLRED